MSVVISETKEKLEELKNTDDNKVRFDFVDNEFKPKVDLKGRVVKNAKGRKAFEIIGTRKNIG